MKTWSRKLILGLGVTALALGAWTTPVRAEVAAVLTADGSFVRTDVRTVRRGRVTSVWLNSDLDLRRDASNSVGQRILLNESGSLRADGAPSLAIHPLTGLPWAVWSFNENGDYELALSYFDGYDWSSPILLGSAPNGADDLQPQMQFAPDGRPLITWWRMSDDGEQQSVWFTSRQNGTWLPPVQVSSAREQSRRPSLMLGDNELIVAYETDRGVRIRRFPADAPMVGGFAPAGGADGPDPPTYDDTRPPECDFIGCDGN